MRFWVKIGLMVLPKILLQYFAFLIGHDQPLNFTKNLRTLDRKLSKLCQNFYLLCWHNALCFPVPIMLKIMPAL